MKSSRRWGAWTKSLLLIVSCTGLPFIALEAWQLALGAVDRPVGRVAVTGNFRFVEQMQVANLVTDEISDQGEDGNFFALDLLQLQQTLQQQTWVDVAQVGRRWPDVLTVKVEEHQPIARWGQRGFLNLRGDLIIAAQKSELMGLPLLEAQDGNEQKVMEQYLGLSKLLRSRDLDIRKLQLLPTDAWHMELNEGGNSFVVALGRDQITEKMQRLLLVFDQNLSQSSKRIEKIDLRYSNGVAVSWREETKLIELS